MAYAIQADDIGKAYGGRPVLDGVSFAVEPASVFALLGPNGAGKTTMIKILSTLVRADRGRAEVCGHDVAVEPDAVRRSISVTGQHAAVDELLTVTENLTMMARLHRLSARHARVRADELLGEFDLGAHRHTLVKECSGGTRRRLDLAVGLINRPEVVFLDEPTTGLDPRSREQLWGSIRALVGAGTTVLLTTQYLEEADQLADRVALLDRGRIVADGRADELKATVAVEVATLEFADDASFVTALDLLSAAAASADSGRRSIDVATGASPDEIAVLLNRLRDRRVVARRLLLRRPSLDDVFFALTGAAHEGSER